MADTIIGRITEAVDAHVRTHGEVPEAIVVNPRTRSTYFKECGPFLRWKDMPAFTSYRFQGIPIERDARLPEGKIVTRKKS